MPIKLKHSSVTYALKARAGSEFFPSLCEAIAVCAANQVDVSLEFNGEEMVIRHGDLVDAVIRPRRDK